MTTTVPWISSNAKLGIGPAGCPDAFVSALTASAAGGGAAFAGSPSAAGSPPSSASRSTGVGGVAGGVQNGVKAPLADPGLMKKRESYSNASNLRSRRRGVSVCVGWRSRVMAGWAPASGADYMDARPGMLTCGLRLKRGRRRPSCVRQLRALRCRRAERLGAREGGRS